MYQGIVILHWQFYNPGSEIPILGNAVFTYKKACQWNHNNAIHRNW